MCDLPASNITLGVAGWLVTTCVCMCVCALFCLIVCSGLIHPKFTSRHFDQEGHEIVEKVCKSFSNIPHVLSCSHIAIEYVRQHSDCCHPNYCYRVCKATQ